MDKITLPELSAPELEYKTTVTTAPADSLLESTDRMTDAGADVAMALLAVAAIAFIGPSLKERFRSSGKINR